MKQLKKAVAYLLCGALLLGNLGNIVSSASAKADNFDSLVSADASKDADKSDASKDADKNDASENTMNDLVSVTSVTYDKTSYAPGEKAEVNIKLSSLNPSDIANQMITVKFFNKTSTYSIFGNLIWDSSASCFSGNVDIPVTALKDDYYIRYVSYLLLKENCAYSVYISNSNITALSVGEAVSEDILVESIVLPEESISLIKGASKTINASVAPENASDKTLKYTSSKPSVATVDRKGVVKALKKGSATITIEAQDGSKVKTTLKVKVSENFVIVLDPGHGGSDPGAVNRYRGLYERNINLRIAKECRDYLEQYDGVSVYLTRESNAGFVGLDARCQFAENCGADVFISMHINASGYRGLTGSEVWVTRSTYKAAYNKKMTQLGKKILNQLSGLGLKKRGVKTRKSAYLKYSFDNTRADYYAVIRGSINRGIPALLIEHGFIDSSDYKYMNSTSKAKKLGIADAKAIVKHYGFTKRSSKEVNVTGIKLNYDYDKITLKKGRSYQLRATVVPSIADDKTVSYSSSKVNIANVSKDGKITAKRKGTAIISCTANDGSGTIRKLKVTVK